MKKFVAIKLGETPAEQPAPSSSNSNSLRSSSPEATLAVPVGCHR